jgi:ribosome-binding protein aMBF1 (putative translation factor)
MATVTLASKTFVILEQSEYERLRSRAQATDDAQLPPLPPPDAEGNYPALPYARASLARKIIRRRQSAGLSQVALARRAGIRPETLNRLEQGRHTPTVATVDKLDRALAEAEAEQAAGVEPDRPRPKKRRPS